MKGSMTRKPTTPKSSLRILTTVPRRLLNLNRRHNLLLRVWYQWTERRARRLVVHLKQPFGALLVTLALTGTSRRAVDYRRAAADSLITVQFQENVSLTDILDNVRTLDVL
jgi:hypothetical protein